jgi:uncharacterized membrane protein
LLIARQRVNVTTADLPGRPRRSTAGTRVLEVYPVLPLIGTVGLGLAGALLRRPVRHHGRGPTATAPDLDVFTEGVHAELRSLALQSTDGALASG